MISRNVFTTISNQRKEDLMNNVTTAKCFARIKKTVKMRIADIPIQQLNNCIIQTIIKKNIVNLILRKKNVNLGSTARLLIVMKN